MKVTIFYIIIFYSFIVNAKTETKINSVDSVLNLSGITEQVSALEGRLPYPMPESIQQTFSSDDLRAEVTKLALNEFKPKLILERIKNRLTKEFSKEELLDLNRYYSSAEIMQFSLLEKNASSPEGRKASSECAAKLKDEVLKQDRIDIIRDHIAETQMNIYNANITVEMMKAIGLAVGNPISLENASKTEKVFQDMAENWNLVTFYCMYKNIPQDSLKKYFVSYKESKNIKKLINLLYEEQKRYYVEWGKIYGNIIKARYSPSKK